ncbi:hypothetical protein Acr_00g0017130 [Actinidia rufa]|uniref:Uncharacterized protein n=1 Tax=Actinidia rufa TaxID=165716 RepID=A0A7J0DCX0_9ERIC|nr:hypothetical protein Acr_00g0017130 [Actinidia rufa]
MGRYLGDAGDLIGEIAIWRVPRNCWCRGGENLAMGGALDIGNICNGDQDALSFCNEWALDIGDILDSDQDALSFCNEWALDIGDILEMAIKTPYRFATNGRLILAE